MCWHATDLPVYVAVNIIILHIDIKKFNLKFIKFNLHVMGPIFATIQSSSLLNFLYSYIEYNARSLDCVKAYAKHIPSFLKNRPKMFVDHCIKRIPPYTQYIPEDNIRQTLNGNFQVRSSFTATVIMVQFTVVKVRVLPHCKVKVLKWFTPCIILTMFYR